MTSAMSQMLAAVEALNFQERESRRLARLLRKSRQQRLAHRVAAGLETIPGYLRDCDTFDDRRNAKVVQRYLRRFGGRLNLRRAA